MPGVKKLHQESENSSKAENIFGHLFGAVGILMGTPQKWFCLPLLMNLQDGVKTIFNWREPSERQDSHVVQMIEQGFAAARPLGKALLLLDRYFLSVPTLARMNELNAPRVTRVHIVSKVKSNAVAYEHPSEKKKGRGCPRKKGATVKLKTLFQSRAAEFQTAQVTIYGKEETVQYLYHELRFVLVRFDDQLSILVSTDLTLAAPDIICLYDIASRSNALSVK
ncbi:hypothetical protein [Paenibacillus sabinae]|uniref:Transposase IS701-like DDE domain-containing protein n=1 Tax=Paenibacillus sabinae T27 TaxID=1268072 RepID=X4ZV11_9BACL|nr:hypothetical protein [Paenibacillus sabinae]AHV95624.1 hypothetical protein PSAB_03440 [Paenibacillus sabinae T27]